MGVADVDYAGMMNGVVRMLVLALELEELSL